jgi:hypothetical protein
MRLPAHGGSEFASNAYADWRFAIWGDAYLQLKTQLRMIIDVYARTRHDRGGKQCS